MKRTRLKKISPKRAQENFIYRLAVQKWKQQQISEDGFLRCEFRGPPYFKSGMDSGEDGRCWENATDVHHRRGRGKWLVYPRFFLGLCRFHHRWVEDNKREARKRGYILYK